MDAGAGPQRRSGIVGALRAVHGQALGEIRKGLQGSNANTSSRAAYSTTRGNVAADGFLDRVLLRGFNEVPPVPPPRAAGGRRRQDRTTMMTDPSRPPRDQFRRPAKNSRVLIVLIVAATTVVALQYT